MIFMRINIVLIRFKYIALFFQRHSGDLLIAYVCSAVLLYGSTSFAQSYGGIGGAVSSGQSSSRSSEVSASGADGFSGSKSAGSQASSGTASESSNISPAAKMSSARSEMYDSSANLGMRDTIRKRALVKKLRFEFSERIALERIIIEQATQFSFSAHMVEHYLNEFSKELDAGLSRPDDLKSLGEDLVLLRETVDVSIDTLLATYKGYAAYEKTLSNRRPTASQTVTNIRNDLNQLAFKNELFTFGNNSLQAMGYFID